eukprot:CAMPEP_0194306988 /NCGR_PEP_ID=MMETSP0171-20130528/3914_1 /TAXON_ID=218684 /ORGANISM="Corethron pennatum, Strain L29A3" /LENGTH=234 /DNA_ID=CAMNT_0039058857 /DNA_START=105 /DNA_END=809 /DNA_ORIENTATION=-
MHISHVLGAGLLFLACLSTITAFCAAPAHDDVRSAYVPWDRRVDRQRHSRRPTPKRKSAHLYPPTLGLSNKQDGNDDPPAPLSATDPEDPFFIGDFSLVFVDLLSILVAFEILGIVDDVAANGWKTFLGPVTVGSLSTFPLLIRRFSVSSILWVLACIRNKGYSVAAVKDEKAVTYTIVRSFVDYCFLGGLFVLGESVGFHHDLHLLEIAQEAFLPLVVLLGFRLFYYFSRMRL